MLDPTWISNKKKKIKIFISDGFQPLDKKIGPYPLGKLENYIGGAWRDVIMCQVPIQHNRGQFGNTGCLQSFGVIPL